MIMDTALMEKIDAFLLQNLGKEEQSAFESNLVADKVLADKVALQSMAHQVVIGNKLKALNDMMEADFASGKVSSQAEGNKIWWKRGLWLSIGMAVVGSLYLLLPKGVEQASETIHKKNTNQPRVNQSGTAVKVTESQIATNQTVEAKVKNIVKSDLVSESLTQKELISDIEPQSNNTISAEPRLINTSPQEQPVLPNETIQTVSPIMKQEESAKEEIKAVNTKEVISFNPDLGEVASISINPDISVEVQILNRAGVLQWKESRQGYDHFAWDGRTQQGSAAVPGMYIYMLYYQNGTKESGSIILY